MTKAQKRLILASVVLLLGVVWLQVVEAQQEAYEACVSAGVQSNETCRAYTR